MRLFKRKSQVQRLGDNIMASLDPSGRNLTVSGRGSASKALRGALPNNGKALKAALDKDAAVKVGLAAGGLTALTAASAGISSLRRRHEGASRDSQS